jgi:hypothetical protein
LFSGLVYWVDGNGFKINKFSSQYQQLNEKRRFYLKALIGIIILVGLNYVPYYDVYNSNIVIFKSLFEEQPHGFYIHKIFFALPIILGLLGSLIILWFDSIFNRVKTSNYNFRIRFYHIISLVFLITYFIILFKDISKISEYKVHQRELSIKAAHNKIINDSIRHYRDSVQRIINIAETKRLKALSEIACTKKSALILFDDWVKLKHPSYKIIKIVNTNKFEDCKFIISCLAKNTEYSYQNSSSLVIEIDLNPDGKYENYKVREIDNNLF